MAFQLRQVFEFKQARCPVEGMVFVFGVAVGKTVVTVGSDQTRLWVSEETRFLFPSQVRSKVIEGFVGASLSEEIADQDEQTAIIEAMDLDG